MKTFVLILFVTVLAGCSKTKNDDKAKQPLVPATSGEESVRIIEKQPKPDTLKGSLKARATGSIGNVSIAISYHSPAVRGRVVWGGLVPFDNVWVTGAHRATSIEFGGDVEIGGAAIAAGKYALFTIPGKDNWTIILNKNWNQHLADDYNEKDDLVRVKVKPETDPTNQERLRYVVESESDHSGKIALHWENLQIRLPIIVPQ